MRISVKGRYALSAMIYLAQHNADSELISIINVSNSLNISKLYLEQVFSMLKKSQLLKSIKGASGGYRLNKKIEDITAYDILAATETALFEQAEATTSLLDIESAINNLVFNKLDSAIQELLKSVTLYDLVAYSEKHKNSNMFYI